MWNMRIELGAGVICVLVAGALPSIVLAQQQPKPFPREKDADKFFSRGIPKVETR